MLAFRRWMGLRIVVGALAVSVSAGLANGDRLWGDETVAEAEVVQSLLIAPDVESQPGAIQPARGQNGRPSAVYQQLFGNPPVATTPGADVPPAPPTAASAATAPSAAAAPARVAAAPAAPQSPAPQSQVPQVQDPLSQTPAPQAQPSAAMTHTVMQPQTGMQMGSPQMEWVPPGVYQTPQSCGPQPCDPQPCYPQQCCPEQCFPGQGFRGQGFREQCCPNPGCRQPGCRQRGGCQPGCRPQCGQEPWRMAQSQDGCDPIHRIVPQDGWIRARGWLDAGYIGNTGDPSSHFNGPYNAVYSDRGQFNQAYFIVDRELRQDGDFDVGGRVDVLYGADYLLGQSAGLEVHRDGTKKWNSSQYYGVAMPQAYLELGNSDLSVKLGHFYSIVGYEGVQSPTNFFYSHSYSYQFGGPFTHWGALATWDADDNWTVDAGLHNGWNTLDGQQNHVSFIGRVKYTSDERDWWTAFALTTGQEGNNPAGLPIANSFDNRTRYSLLFDKQFDNGLEYVFHHWLGLQENGDVGGGTAMWYGIDQYLYYRINECHKVGTRFEWFDDPDGTRVGLTLPSNPNKAPLPGNYFSWSVGENWTPTPNLTVRPEIRWDVYSGNSKPFDDGTKNYQVMLGLDAIYQF